jgi:uncharacterized protein (DUF1501 family)
LIKTDPGARIAVAESGGWDCHTAQGNSKGPLADKLREFSRAIAAFWADMGDLVANTVIVTISEFGRTVGENARGGTDHGHGNVMFVLGGPVKGGKVYGGWPGLEQWHDGKHLKGGH